MHFSSAPLMVNSPKFNLLDVESRDFADSKTSQQPKKTFWKISEAASYQSYWMISSSCQNDYASETNSCYPAHPKVDRYYHTQ